MALVFAVLLPFLAIQQLEPLDVASRVQQVYDGAAALRCDFRQAYRSGTTGKETNAEGRLLLKRPGKMRWDYTKPEEKLYLSDGRKAYWYLPVERQVNIIDLEKAEEQQTQILFLMGKGDLIRDFTITSEEGFQPLNTDSFMLHLVPKQEEPFDYLVMEVIPRDYLVVRLIVVDPFGNITDYRFDNIAPASIDDSNFVFPERILKDKKIEVFEDK